MNAVIYATRRSLAAAAEVTTEEIQEQHMKHIAEIVIAPPQSEKLNYVQECWLRKKMRSPMGKPYKQSTPDVIPYKWIGRTPK